MNFAQITLFTLLIALSFEVLTAVDYSYRYKDPETNSGAPLSLTNKEIEPCGNGVCDDGEDADNCADDCKCNNNGICEEGETPAACSLDCSCGNYKCEPELGETVSTCEHDCGCNRNFICESHENYEHCPEDCTEDTSEDISDASNDEETEEEVSDSV